jgi:hypothetical protein
VARALILSDIRSIPYASGWEWKVKTF